MAKKVLFNQQATEKLLTGINTLSNAVKETLGAGGRLVLIEEPHGVRATKDGVSVAEAIHLSDHAENTGARLIRQAAQKTVKSAGDGTSTSITLAQKLILLGVESIKNGSNPVTLVNELKLATSDVIAKLRGQSVSVKGDWDRIRQIAVVSMNGDEKHAELLANSMKEIGDDGVVLVEGGASFETSVDVVKGLEFDSGYNTPLFVNSAKNECVFENPYIFTTTDTIENMEQVLSALQIAIGKQRSILFICNNSTGEGHSAMVVQKMKGNFPLCVVNAPSFGDMRKEYLMDISAVTGSTVLGSEYGREMKNCAESDLGTCEKVVVTKDKTIIIGGGGKKSNVEKRIASVRGLISSNEDNQEYKKRLAKLSGGIALIRAGGITPASISELKDRLDDAMNATRCAVEEGVVPGGGIAYLNCKTDNKILKEALQEPFRQILINAGMESEISPLLLLDRKPNEGMNVRTRQIEDFFETGVIDATKVVVSAIENAVDVAALVLLNNVVIVSE